MAKKTNAADPARPTPVRIDSDRHDRRRTVGETVVALPAVSFDLKNGSATFQVAESEYSRATEMSIPSDWLVFLAHYFRVRRAFSSDVQMAEMLGLDRTRLIAWKKGASVPRNEHLRYLADVATTVDALMNFLHPPVVADWLTAPRLEFSDKTPVEMLREGRLPDVLMSVDAAEQGVSAARKGELLAMFNAAATELNDADHAERERLVDAFAHRT
jgi:transcriptional regulator with XRE-family HTH domain